VKHIGRLDSLKNNNLSRDLNSVWEIGRLLGHAAQIWRNTSFGAVAEKLLLFKVQLFCSLFLSIGHALQVLYWLLMKELTLLANWTPQFLTETVQKSQLKSGSLKKGVTLILYQLEQFLPLPI
jgi:hypothetical protein